MDMFAFMLKQKFKDITEPKGINSHGVTYVLSSSDVLPLFRTEYKIDRTVLMSQQLIVDTTARENKTLFYRLMDKYPRTSQ
jgi:hypothetical protein